MTIVVYGIAVVPAASAEEWPSLERKWGNDDYRRAASILATKAETRLPRLSEPSFAPIFAKLTDPQNIAFITDKRQPVDERVQRGADLIGHVNSVNGLYVAAFAKGESYSEETIKLLAFVLAVSAVEARAFSDYIDSLDKTDPSYATRMVGVAQVRFGLSQTLLGAIHSLAETDNYRIEHRRHLGAVVQRAMPTIIDRIDADVADAMLIRYHSIREQHPDLNLRKLEKINRAPIGG